MDGVDVGVIGAVTEETPSLVTPGGIADLEFGDPVDAVNRVAAQLIDGDAANGEADVLVAELPRGRRRRARPTAPRWRRSSPPAARSPRSSTRPSAAVDAIFTGHTHKQYAWDGPGPGCAGETRPIVQTGNYGEFIGKVVLTVDTDDRRGRPLHGRERRAHHARRRRR